MRDAELTGPLEDPADHLPGEAGHVEATLAGHDQVGPIEGFFESGFGGDDLEAGLEARTDRGETAGETPGRARAVEGGHVDTGSPLVLERQALQAPPQQLDLSRGRTLLRPVERRGVDEGGGHVVRDGDVEASERPAQRLEGGEPTVGGGAAADTDEDPLGAAARCGGEELTGAACGRA